MLKKQNILFFTRTMKLGGTENVVLQLCEIFSPLVNKIVVCSCGGVNEEKLKLMGIKHYTIPDIENKSPKSILETIRTVNKIVINEKITIIHTHHRMAAFYVSLLKIYKNCCFINTSHNTFTNRKSLTSYAYKHANLIACGQMVKNNLVTFFDLPDKQVTVIHNAVKPYNEKIVEDALLTFLKNKGSFIVCNVGRLSEQKGMEYFIKSIPEVINKNPSVRFVVVGTGEDEEKLKELARHTNVEEYLYFFGYRSDIQNIMSQVDVVVLSSLWEGLPLTPIEAFSVGKTVIGTAVDGTVEIIKDGINGFLIEPKNPQMIADKINYLVNHREVLENLEAQAYSTYLNSFSFENLKLKYIEFYKGVIKDERI